MSFFAVSTASLIASATSASSKTIFLIAAYIIFKIRSIVRVVAFVIHFNTGQPRELLFL